MYARDPDEVEKAKVDKLVSMGFNQSRVEEALMRYGWDEAKTVNALLSGQ